MFVGYVTDSFICLTPYSTKCHICIDIILCIILCIDGWMVGWMDRWVFGAVNPSDWGYTLYTDMIP